MTMGHKKFTSVEGKVATVSKLNEETCMVLFQNFRKALIKEATVHYEARSATAYYNRDGDLLEFSFGFILPTPSWAEADRITETIVAKAAEAVGMTLDLTDNVPNETEFQPDGFAYSYA